MMLRISCATLAHIGTYSYECCINMAPSRLYVDSRDFGLSPREKLGKKCNNPDTILVCSGFFKVFQAQILRKYSRRSCGSFWSGLELRKPKIDRFRPNVPICFYEKCVFL